jgi:adenylosuccinate lyase
MSTPNPLYDLLTQLDRLEDLREDLQELALRGGVGDEEELEEEGKELDQEAILAEMTALGVKTLGEVEERIAQLNARLDHLEEGGEGA